MVIKIVFDIYTLLKRLYYMELDFNLKVDVYLFMTSRLIFQVASLLVVLSDLVREFHV